MSRLSIEMPTDFGDDAPGPTGPDAPGTTNEPHRATVGDDATRSFVDWVECWAGA